MTFSRIGVKLLLAVVALLAIEGTVRYVLETSSQARVLRDGFMRSGRAHALTLAKEAE